MVVIIKINRNTLKLERYWKGGIRRRNTLKEVLNGRKERKMAS